jgi:phosphopantetheine adenylyltransferase
VLVAVNPGKQPLFPIEERDAEGEISLANINRTLAPDIETVLVPADPELSEVSSSRLKELVRKGLDVSRYRSPEIAGRLRKQLAPDHLDTAARIIPALRAGEIPRV